ncbi:calcium-binding protein [Microvirga soli]|uniref:calcium-binding protein n=1 Tax=Microvirga soli TaxID=1854496 RepID=UPI001AEE74A1|nr:hypothetical protein [Microvirga soli]
MDGSSWAKAGTISNLSSFIAKAGANGEVLLRADQGAYKVTGQTTIRVGGEMGAPVTIRGVDATGKSMNAQFVGTRATDWSTGKPEGTEVFRLLAGADHLKFQNMAFENIGNGAFRIGADIKNLTLEHMQANNVRRFLEDTISSGYATASVDGLKVKNVNINKFSQNAIKLRYDSRNILIEDVTGNGDADTPEKYVQGIMLDDTAHNVIFRNVVMQGSNARGSSTEYWNGDGFTTEAGNYNIRFENTVASGNTDAGYDLKSSNTVLFNTIAEGNNRNYRFWSTSITMESGQSRDPHYFGGSASINHIWLADGAHAKISGGSILDRNVSVTVFDLWKTGALVEVNGMTINTSGKLSGLGSNSQVLMTTATAPETAPSPTLQTLTIDLIDIDEAPAPTFSARAVNEGGRGGTIVGRLKAGDPEGGAVGYQLSSDSANFFALMENDDGSCDVVVRSGITLDYETFGHRSFDVTVSDSKHEVSGTFALNLADLIDRLTGTQRKDVLRGQSGSDIIKGLGDDDLLTGNGGGDRLHGGSGKDILTGGSGPDIFVFDGKPNKETNLDRVTDFSVRDDAVWLDNKVFAKLGKAGSSDKPASLSKAFFATTTAKDRNDYLIYNKETGMLSYDADGSGFRSIAVEIAQMKNGLGLSHKDFFVI